MANAPDETAALKENKDQPLPIGVFALFTPDEAMPKDRGLYVKRRGGLTLAAFLVIAICWSLGQSTGFVEDDYAAHLGQGISRAQANLTGLLPTSLAEVLLVLVAAWFLAAAGIAAVHVFQRRRRFFNALACGTLRVLCFSSIVAALFYMVWGINYFRRRLSAWAGRSTPKPPPTAKPRLKSWPNCVAPWWTPPMPCT